MRVEKRENGMLLIRFDITNNGPLYIPSRDSYNIKRRFIYQTKNFMTYYSSLSSFHSKTIYVPDNIEFFPMKMYRLLWLLPWNTHRPNYWTQVHFLSQRFFGIVHFSLFLTERFYIDDIVFWCLLKLRIS